jgi:CheY-like chemotaxis protein/HPt (histidine-containing phosphotransfer) domain-containing protein
VKRLGATLALADNGEQAVAAALAQRFDLVLMDMQMPVMDGLSAVRTLRAGGYTGTIVALTANATRDDMQACLDAGCDDFLTKPVERERFEAALRRHLPAAAGQRPAAAPPAALLDGAAPGDAAYAGRLGQLRPALGALASRARSAADAADPVAAKQVGRELSSLGRQLGCEPALLLGGQFEFAGAAKDLRTVRRLLGRLNALVERVDTGLRGATAADDGPIFSALLTQGPDMADLVAYFLTKLPDYLERMRSAVAALDFGRIARCAHDLKSVGGGYGYPMLRELALAVEKAAKAQDAPAVAELLQRFETLTRRIVAAGGPARTGASQRLPEPTSEPALP